ncbi:MAG: hypothetical protein QNJ98_18705, partial [Planctomycetota bacterium]|nr:hypothetical protein [Planctomycetota bacterium]
MRLTALALVLIALLVSCPFAEADSWAPPEPRLASSEDGRWYVVMHPGKPWSKSDFVLVRRAAGKPAREEPELRPPTRDHKPRIELEEGDEVVARGRCTMPMDVKCLDDGQGFIRFDTYANVGSRAVIERFDAKGKPLWSKTLFDLFPKEVLRTFMQTVSSVWWSETIWIDEETDELVVVWKRDDNPGVLRLALKDGAKREGSIADIHARIGRPPAREQLGAFKLARKHKLDGLAKAVRAAFANEKNAERARVAFAAYLYELGDEAGRAYVIGIAQNGKDPRARAYALPLLPDVVGTKAIGWVAAALAAENDRVWGAAIEAMRGFGEAAVPTLAAVVRDR